jgi:hypothetical protein
MARRNAIVSVEFKRKEFCFVKLHTSFTNMLSCDVIGMRPLCTSREQRWNARLCSGALLLLDSDVHVIVSRRSIPDGDA